MNRFLNVLQGICYFLVIVGALNWGLVGAFGFNLVEFLFGDFTILARIVYILVGVSAIVSAVLTVRCTMETGEEY